MWLRGFLAVCMFMFLPANIQLIAKTRRLENKICCIFMKALGVINKEAFYVKRERKGTSRMKDECYHA